MDNKKKPTNKRLNKLFNNMQYEEPDTEPRRDEDKVVGKDESDSVGTSPQEIESAPSEREAEVPEVEQDGGESIQPEVPAVEMVDEISPDDLLEDVRRSLITETVEKEEEEQSKWWKRIGRGSKRKKKEADDVVQPLPEPVSVPVDAEPVIAATEEKDEYVEQLDELIDMLADEPKADADVSVEETAAALADEPTPEKEAEVIDFKELKERAFHARTMPEEEERSLSEVRAVALEDGEEVFVEVEAKPEDALQDRMKAFENSLKPYRRYFYFVFIFVSLVMVTLVSISLYRLYLRSLPPPTPEEVALLPYPVAMNLPGGLKFNLGKGELQEGRWNPRGPEWLEGTEVCRWIAIPYSRQLEAVVRTLTREDQIELIMSNNDTLTYTVDSIDQLTLEDMQSLDSSSPCMLLVLAQSGEDERWVVTAIP